LVRLFVRVAPLGRDIVSLLMIIVATLALYTSALIIRIAIFGDC
jgi:hypothetical protein